MKTIEILLQGEAIADIQLVNLPDEAGPDDVLKAAKALRHGGAGEDGEFLLFAEDEDEPLKGKRLPKRKDGEPVRLHVHRCRKITVSVTYNGVTKSEDFAPGRTVASVKTWAARKAFDMDPRDAAEHVLQLAGGVERPEPDTHIGALVSHKSCVLRFDLVPLKRVEG